jgi:signal transduction histidine kinase
VANLYGDAPRPDLTVDVRSDLALDWTTEAVVLRIVQEAVNNVWRHARAARLRVTIGATGDELTVEVLDDGVGIGDARPGRGIASMQAVAGFVDGELAIVGVPGGGTRAVATFRIGPPPAPARRPHLRLVEDR